MKRFAKALLFSSVLVTLAAQAYIPKFWMIMSRTAESHGRGIYKVIQDVAFLHKDEPIILRETWHIQDAQNMRVDVEAFGDLRGKVQLTYVYKDSKKYFVASDGVKKVQMTSKDWFEPYFHFRFSKHIKPKMLAQNMIPASALKEAEGFKPTVETKEEKNSSGPAENSFVDEEPFLRLSRTGGTIAYTVGAPSTSGNLNSGMWIEQDRFNILKIRLASNSEIVASKYNKYARGMELPKIREVDWDNNKVEIRVVSVIGLSAHRKNKVHFSPKSLDLKANPNVKNLNLEDPVIEEFYKRFR